MKHLHTILAVFTLLTAMSIVSCEKETYTEPVDQTVYYLSMGEIPEIVSGNDTTVMVKVQTNIPANELNVGSSDKWLIGHVSDGNIIVKFDENPAGVRSGTVTVIDTKRRAEPASCTFKQGYARRQAVNKPGMVQFKDYFFKQACLEIADTDHDGEISPDEAEAVQELVVPGKRINDLTGIEAFKNVWKLDAGDNNIEDAMAVTELHRLHWLNLRGNMNLKCFDVRGCTSYFENCTFEVTEDLDYYLYYRYIGIHWKDDTACKHSHHSKDPRLTEDWSREGETYEVYHHTEGPGKVAVVFSGIGWIDVDVNDGTFERIVHEAIENLKIQPGWAQNWKYLDVYVMVHMAEKRSQWMYWNEQISCMGPEEYALDEAYNNHRIALWKQMRDAVENKYQILITVDSHSNMKINFPVIDFGGINHIIPNSDFDHREEGYPYQYDYVSKCMELLDFRIATPLADPKEREQEEKNTVNWAFEEKPWLWTDWLDYD